MSDLDIVAEAIWSQHGLFGPASWDITDATRDRYRRMAKAAIDALQLTQHWAVTTDRRDGQVYSVVSRSESITRELAEERRPYGAPDDEVISRWVTPWTAVTP